jgi:hypothetical protein
VKRVTREKTPAKKTNSAAPKSAKTAKTNATRPRPGPGGAEIRKDR